MFSIYWGEGRALHLWIIEIDTVKPVDYLVHWTLVGYRPIDLLLEELSRITMVENSILNAIFYLQRFLLPLSSHTVYCLYNVPQ